MSNAVQALSVGVVSICSFHDVVMAYSHFRNRFSHQPENREARVDSVADNTFMSADGLSFAKALPGIRGGGSSGQAECRWAVISIAIGASAALVVASASSISLMVIDILKAVRQGSEASTLERALRSIDWVILTLALPIITAEEFVCTTLVGLSLAPLWYKARETALSERLQSLALVVGRAVSRPFALIAYEFAALSGVLHPSFGRALFGKVCLVCGEPWYGDLHEDLPRTYNVISDEARAKVIAMAEEEVLKAISPDLP